jgi:hypothetical protein
MNNLTYEDLKTGSGLDLYLKDTTYNIIEFQLKKIDKCTIEDHCNCGCFQCPIADVFVFINKGSYIRKYGLRLYPTRNCVISILNCDQRGASIKKTIYDAVKLWHNSINTPYERQISRTNSIKMELYEKTFKLEDFLIT